MILANYKIEDAKNINFLIDYSQFLIKEKKYDESILNWQAENSFALKPLGLNMPFLLNVQ